MRTLNVFRINNGTVDFHFKAQLNHEDDTDGDDDDDDKVVKRLYLLLTYLAIFKFADKSSKNIKLV